MLEELPDNWETNATSIGKGGRREIFIYSNKYVVKKYLPKYKKNLNEVDLHYSHFIYSTVPEEYKKYFLRHLFTQDSCLVTHAVLDYDGEISKNLSLFNQKELLTKEVFDVIEKIIVFLINQEIYFYDIRPENIIIKKISNSKVIPIFFDFKNINRNYLMQPLLVLKSQKIKKIKRRLHKNVLSYFS